MNGIFSFGFVEYGIFVAGLAVGISGILYLFRFVLRRYETNAAKDAARMTLQDERTSELVDLLSLLTKDGCAEHLKGIEDRLKVFCEKNKIEYDTALCVQAVLDSDNYLRAQRQIRGGLSLVKPPAVDRH